MIDASMTMCVFSFCLLGTGAEMSKCIRFDESVQVQLLATRL